jgi:hypothetical protein
VSLPAHNDALHSPPDISSMINKEGRARSYVKYVQSCTGKHRAKLSLGTLNGSWTDSTSFKTNVIEVLCKGANSIQLVEDTFRWLDFGSHYLSRAL